MTESTDYVYAKAHTLDYRCETRFDAGPWLSVADKVEILSLVENDYSNCGEAIAALYVAESNGDESVKRFFANHNALSAAGHNLLDIHVMIEPEDVARFLFKNRPDVAEYAGLERSDVDDTDTGFSP